MGCIGMLVLGLHLQLAFAVHNLACCAHVSLSKVVPTAQKTCDFTDLQLGHKRHMPRAMNRKMKAELRCRRILNAAIQQYVANKCSNDVSWQAPMRE